MHIFIFIYALTIFYGVLLGFTFDGVAILIAGILMSLFSTYIWNDVIFANVVALISAGLATYFFTKKY